MTLIEALERVRLFSGGRCRWMGQDAQEIETVAAAIGLNLSNTVQDMMAWGLHVFRKAAGLPGFFQRIEPTEKQILVLADVGGGENPRRETFDRAAIESGLRRQVLLFSLVGYAEMESETDWIVLPYERVDADVERRFPLSFLAANRDLHMDMSREAGRRSDAHLARYRFASERLAPTAVVLDAACGLGYGAALVAREAEKRRVHGADIDRSSVDYATANFGVVGTLDFRVADATRDLPWESNTFDAVVSFETLEHLENPAGFLREVWRVLREDGLFVASVPYKWMHGWDLGPYHKDWFDAAKLVKLSGQFLSVEEIWTQTAGGAVFCSDEPRAWKRVPVLGEEPTWPAEWAIVIARRRTLLRKLNSEDWVFVAAGIPQLSTMLAALDEWKIDPRVVTVFGTSPISSYESELAMSECAEAFGLRYGGNLFVEPDHRLAGDPADYGPDDPTGRSGCGARILAKNPILESLRGCNLAIAVRSNMPSDYAFVEAVAPRQVRLVTDGIQNAIIVRDYTGSRGFHPNILSRLPGDAEIWCPPWLRLDADALGRARPLPEQRCRDVLSRVSQIPCAASGAHHGSDGRAPFTGIVVSQQFHRSGLTSPDAEMVFYLHQIRRLLHTTDGRVLFKAHPRDSCEKTQRIVQGLCGLEHRVHVSSGIESVLPLEAFPQLASSGARIEVWGTSSSALLGVAGWPGVKVSCIDAEYLEGEIRRQAIRFSQRHKFLRVTLHFADNCLGENERHLLRRTFVSLLKGGAIGASANPEIDARTAEIVRLRSALEANQIESVSFRGLVANLQAAMARSLVRVLEIHAARSRSTTDHRSICIWGAGSGGSRVLAVLRGLGASVRAFIDSDPNKLGSIVAGVPVIGPTELLNPAAGRSFVVIASTHAGAIAESMEAKGWWRTEDFVAIDFDEVAAWERQNHK